MNALIDINNLTKIFKGSPNPAIKSLNVTIPKGQIVGLVGPDGSGKTTLIRLMAALLLPTEGSIVIAGKNSAIDPESVHDNTGYMPQKFGLYEDLTVSQNLTLYADLKGILGVERREKFEKLLKFTNLQSFQNRLTKNLSGGMKQKLGLACALLKKPKLLLLDEPSVGVDPISRKELWKMVLSLLEEGISVIWSTAYLDEAEKCHTVLLLNKGEMLFFGNPQHLTQRVQGRVFLLTQLSSNQRALLKKTLSDPEIIDGVIQGKNIRLVFKNLKEPDHSLVPIVPRFEDAFVDILGGGPGGESRLAETREMISKKQNEPVVKAEALTKQFGSFIAVEKLNLNVMQGEVFGLLGPNGAGKSTTFKMLCGLLKPTRGSALVNGINLEKAPAKGRSQIGYMAQKFSLYGNLSLLQNLTFFSGIYNLKGQEQKKAIEESIAIFDFQPYLHTSSELLPLGFKQRLSLACAVIHKPPLLFLDEPTSGVDPITRREFWNHINGLVEKGVTVLVTTHFMDEAEYCDRIALIYGGKIVNMDTPDALKEKVKRPSNPFPTLEEAFIHLIENSHVK